MYCYTMLYSKNINMDFISLYAGIDQYHCRKQISTTAWMLPPTNCLNAIQRVLELNLPGL